MRRDIGSELVVAIVAVAALAFALSFAILLALSSNNVQAEQTTVADSNVNEDEPVETTPEVALISDTPTEQGLPPRITESIPTQIEVSETAQRDASPTAVRPTLTSTQKPTKSPTFTPTFTLTFTSTPTSTVTPTFTPSSTNTPTFTPTATPFPTRIAGILPTPTHFSLPVLQDFVRLLRQDETCRPNTSWRVYEVQSGNTLFAIAMAVNSTVDELQQANCLPDASRITTGDLIYVPRLPSGSVRNIPETRAESSQQVIIGCGNPNVRITSPNANQVINGNLPVVGTVQDRNFWYYKIEIQPPNSTTYNFITDGNEPVQNDVLAMIDTNIFGTGVHRIRLSMIDVTAGIQENATCDIPVIFE